MTSAPADVDEAVRNAHAWFEHNSGWAPPDEETLAEWVADGVCRCPDECLVAPRDWCEHGLASWWLILRAIDEQVVLDHFGIGAGALLGEGGEARVFALDADRVLRIPHGRTSTDDLEARRALLDAVAGASVVALPEVLEHRAVADRLVVVERRLPGRNALQVLGEDCADRAALVRHHLDVAASIAALPCPTDRFGELWGAAAITSDRFRSWAIARLEASLERGGNRFAHLDVTGLTDELCAALPTREPTSPVLVHLDAYLGNMLADGDRITAVLDFGPMAIGGPAHLDPLSAVAYLAPEITPTANDDDRAVARAWASDRGLLDALAPAERWVAAYWTFATDDEALQRWCRRILGVG
ncbi:MAG TPA: aminoglycoside phosphotransferase family protein [Acidimicrobiales bacterium]|nr:aminoglycoside phosphotransferase family protein [Acidimicrobiales bacterium]